MRPVQISKVYFTSSWMPTAGCMLALGALAVAAMAFRALAPAWVLNFLLICVLLSLLAILAAAVVHLFRKRWKQAIVNLLLFGGSVGATVVVSFMVLLASFFGPSEDGFADRLTVPTNVEVADPAAEVQAQPNMPRDAFQEAMLKSLATPGGEDAAITANMISLAALERSAPGILQRYLAANPSWRVFQERGHRFATRRWMIGSEWNYAMNGYYTKLEINRSSEPDTPEFQSRFTIGMSGVPWAARGRGITSLGTGETKSLSLSSGNGMDESHCVIKVGNLAIEAFEQSGAKERRLTKAALAQLEKELAPIAAKPDWTTIRQNLPQGSIRRGKASLGLRNSFQPGIYQSVIWANPGEPGMVYLKAFEVTKGTPLSVDRLKQGSNEWIGWSEDAEELFLSNADFTIYEGDWGKPYAAKFEVWFAPDFGAADRKLVEKVFKIEGWQR